ncbi:Armadillo-like helical [Artemisia annua]|uniref:Armadillo-like helical n=1 Tax=Artemisia annua TaxID=35608 RepID=A0A2U1KHH2_ARTAN|nr:Armadillo-like helical [Artemisia annua]
MDHLEDGELPTQSSDVAPTNIVASSQATEKTDATSEVIASTPAKPKYRHEFYHKPEEPYKEEIWNRNDAGLAAAELVLAVEKHVLESGSVDTVGTVVDVNIKLKRKKKSRLSEPGSTIDGGRVILSKGVSLGRRVGHKLGLTIELIWVFDMSHEHYILGRHHKHVKSELSNLERKTVNKVDDGDHSSLEEDADKYKEQLEAVFFKLKESKSYRRTVRSISISCITAATPLLSSLKQTAYLIDLDIVEHLRKWKNPINWRQEPRRSL